MQEKVNALNEKLKKLKLMGKLCSVFIVICFIVLFQNFSIALGMFAVLALFFFFVFRRRAKKYQQEVKTTILCEGMRPLLGPIQFAAKDATAKEEVLAAGFPPAAHPKDTIVRDSVRANRNGRALLLTDVTTNYLYTITDRRGKAAKRIEYLCGCWLQTTLPAAPADFLLWPKGVLPATTREAIFPGWEECPLPAEGAPADLAADFHLYAPAGGPEPFLSDRLARALQQLKEYTTGQAALQVQGGQVRLFLLDRFVYTLRLPIRMTITPALLQTNPLPELEYMLRVVDTIPGARR